MNGFFILVNAILANNIVLTCLFGLYPQLAFSERLDVAKYTSIINFFLIVLTVPFCFLIEELLLEPYSLTHLGIIFYLLTSYLLALNIQYLISVFNPLLTDVVAVIIPLSISNSVILGTILLGLEQETLVQATWFAFGAATGFALILLSITLLREKITHAAIPTAFRGLPILIMTFAIMSLTFFGFSVGRH